MSPKQERRRARHARRVSRRALLKQAGTAVAAVTASLFIPRMVHAGPSRKPHPTWDLLLDRVGAKRYPTLGDPPAISSTADGGLRGWVHGLVLRPDKPQRALLLTGPAASGKTTFHQAMGLLLPPNSVVQYPGHFPDSRDAHQREWEEMLERAWLMVIDDVPGLHGRTFGVNRWRVGRYLKWCLTFNGPVTTPLPNVQHYEIEQDERLAMPKTILLRRLEDERDAFQRTLRNYAA